MLKYLFILFVLIVSSCKENSTVADLESSYDKDQEAGLILVVETRYDLGPGTELLFKFYQEQFLDILSDIFEIDKANMQDMTLSQIVEVFGEDWQISAMKKAVEGHYSDIKVLTDTDCTGRKLMGAIEEFAQKGYYIDMVFSLHASEEKEISFLDRLYHVDEFTNYMESNNYNVRAIYQTCCYGQNYISDWQNAGVYALNGAAEINSISMISPVYFLEEWVGNKLPFDKAVAKAFDREVEKLKSYNNILPIETFFLTKTKLNGSRMLTGGLDDGLLWSEFPIDQKN